MVKLNEISRYLPIGSLIYHGREFERDGFLTNGVLGNRLEQMAEMSTQITKLGIHTIYASIPIIVGGRLIVDYFSK